MQEGKQDANGKHMYVGMKSADIELGEIHAIPIDTPEEYVGTMNPNPISSNPVPSLPQLSTKHSKFQRSLSAEKVSQDLKWAHVDFIVGKKQILDDCWGHVPSGKICSIMGPSGAGKTSLLNVLAGRSAPSHDITIHGRVNVSGVDVNPVTYRQHIAYVMQQNALLATATPRESFLFSAKLRLPPDTLQQEISEIVDSLVEDLGLTSCANVMIGGPLIAGISGGQKKRTSVGVELITNPSLLFLDEPTSGLDSYSAYCLVKLLRTVAINHTAVLCTIHQPSSEVFFLSDIVIFMNAGRILYQGSPTEIVAYFSRFGYECPSSYNPSDYIMFINQTESTATLQAKGLFMNKAPEELFPDYHKVGKSHSIVRSEKDIIIKSSYLRQLSMLTQRELTNVRRDKGAMIARFGLTIFLNLLIGLIFLRVGSKDNADPTNFQAHFGGLMMAAIFSMMGSAQQTMLSIPFDRPMFLREYSTGTYQPSTYFLGKMFVEVPLIFLQALVQYIIIYFLMNLQGNFILLVLSSWGLGVTSSSIAVIVGCSVTDVKHVSELAPLVFVPQMLFAGFFVRLSQIPVFLRWAQYLCGLKYAMNLLLAIEFRPGSSSCSGSAHRSCLNVLNENQINLKLIWLYALLLGVLFALFRIVGAMILVQRAKRFY
jgi:ABC-type multidrug transport system ATPase subunit/ABC-type multidrug transport system permease subunit